MKRIIFIITLIICSLHSIGQINYTERFSISDFVRRDTLCPDNQTYTCFPAFPEATLFQPGQPALPTASINFLIPTSGIVDSIVILEEDPLSIALTHKIFPFQPPAPNCGTCPPAEFISMDSSVYFSNNVFPVINYTSSSGYWHKAQILTVQVCPFKYYPLSNNLVLNNTLTIAVYYTEKEGDEATQKVKMTSKYYSEFTTALSKMVQNPTSIAAFVTGIDVVESKARDLLDLPTFDYVVIAPSAFINTSPMNTFIEWKKRKGIDIGVISMTDVYNYSPPGYTHDDTIGNYSSNFPNNKSINDDAAELRQYLAQVYKAGGCKKVLLVGDESKVPVRKYYAHHNSTVSNPITPSYVITDKYYADFNSDYAVDANNDWGEITPNLYSNIGDKVDLYPEAFVGRVPCSTIQEFEIWVNKLINYETNPGDGDASYLKRFVMTMADGPQNAILSNYPTTLTNLGFFNPLRIFKELPSWNTYPYAPLGAAIIDSLNHFPAGWWTWDNHGDPGDFLTMTSGDHGSTMSWINSSDSINGLLHLTNVNKYGIISSNCCNVACFEVNGNMLDASIFNSKGGSVAFVGNTDVGWYPTGEWKLNDLSSILKSCHQGNNQVFTGLCAAEWHWYIGKYQYSYDNYETYLTNNFFGDPDMLYYTKEPSRINANISPRHIDRTAGDTITITLNNFTATQNVRFSLFQGTASHTVYQDTLPNLSYNHGDLSAEFIIPADSLQEGILYLTISAFNHLPYTDEIIVSPGCSKNSSLLVISTTPVLPWGDRFINQDVTINSGVALTITGKIYFVPNCKIKVMPGAKLIIDGGSLAASCEGLWDGIDIVGNSSLTQYSNTNQGFVQVTNSGCIQDAKIALGTAQTTASGFVAGTSGGTFSCTNAKFLNNKCCIHIYPYQHLNDNYNSNISRTSFTLDDKYIGTTDSCTMVYLDGIKGLGITGSSFTNTSSQGGFPIQRGIGLKTINAGFRLTHTCLNGNQLPCTDTIKPFFSGLYYGIHCLNTTAAKFVQVEHTDFTDNYRGIYLSAVVNPSITQCYFKTKTGSGLLPSSGLYLDHCTGYSIQENTFEGCNQGGTTIDYGIVVNSSGTAPNEIYNNLFSSLQYGIAAQDTNRNPVNGVGLVCKCNDFSSNRTDQAVLTFSSLNTSKGIALYQGDSLSITGLAGNTFSQRSLGSGTYDLYNQGSRFKYYHHSNTATKRLKPVPQLCTNVYLKEWIDYSYDKQTSCPSKLNSGGSNLEEMKVEFQSTSNSVQQKETELQGLTDGGSTQQTTEDIIYSIPPEALILRDELLTKSPYLSDTVLQSAVANEYVLPNVMIRDILVANPQSASSEPVLNELDKRTEPMPEDLYNQILDAESAYSPLEIREMELASLKSKQYRLFNLVVTNYLSDNTGSVDDSLKFVLQNAPFPEGRYLLALKQMAENDTMATTSTLQSISTLFELNNEQQAIFNDYLNYFEILKEMNRDTLPGTETDSIQTASLLTLMTNVKDPVKSYIRNILIANKVITYEEPYLFADELKASRIRKTNPTNNEEDAMLQISPNPATGYVIVRYDLNSQIAAATFEVVSLHGQVLLSKPLNKSCDQFVVSLSGFTPGVYIASVKVRGKTLKSIRIVVVK